MKRIFVYLMPWMAMVASAQSATLRPAAIHMPHLKEAPAYRLADECWVSPNAFLNWGWAYRFIGNEATIDAEGRTLKITGKAIDGKFLLPMHEILGQLGAGFGWQKGRDTLDVWGQVRQVTVRGGEISFDSTLPITPKASFTANPNRLVLDLKGVRLAESVKTDLDAQARVGQFTPDTVRLVIVTDAKPLLTLGASRSHRFRYREGAEPEPQPQPQTQPTVTPVQTTPPNQDFTPPTQPGVAVFTQAGPLSVQEETATTVIYRLALPQALQGAPKFKRLDPMTIQLDLPKATYVAPEQPLGSPTLIAVEPSETSDGLRLILRFNRAVGVTFSHQRTHILLSLIKPAVGNGRLAGRTIVVDAGHGAHDSGARAPDGSANEKDIVLKVSRYLARFLTEQGATVIMTRDSDTFVNLSERPAVANRNAADFFISVHVNSNKVDNSASGSISFFHGGRPLGELLATCIESEIKKVSALPSMGVWSDRRIYNSGFAVLRNAKMPAVLLELGFINHRTDRARLIQDAYHRDVARAIVKGIRVYLGDGTP